MPKIPRYESQISPVAKGPNAYVEKPEYLTVGMKDTIGRVISEIGQEGAKLITEYEAKKERARKVVEASQVETSAMMDSEAFLDSIKSRSDYHNFEREANDFVNTTMQKYRGMVRDENDWKLYTPKLELMASKLKMKTKNIADNKQFEDWRISWKTQTTPAYMKAYVNGDDGAANEYEGVTRALISVGSLSADEGAVAIRDFKKNGDFKRAVSYIDTKGLNAWEKLSAEERTEMFSNMDTQQWSRINAVVKSLRTQEKEIAKSARDKNENTATLIATGDTYTLESGATIKLTPEQKDVMLRDMVEAGSIDDKYYLRLKAYYQGRGGKAQVGNVGKKPNIKPMYRKNADGSLETFNVDKNDPDVVGTMTVEGWRFNVPSERKSASDRLIDALNAGKKPIGGGQSSGKGYIYDPNTKSLKEVK